MIATAASGVHAAHKVTQTVPIVAIDLESDPVASGAAQSLNRPGGNVTGIFLDAPEHGGQFNLWRAGIKTGRNGKFQRAIASDRPAAPAVAPNDNAGLAEYDR